MPVIPDADLSDERLDVLLIPPDINPLFSAANSGNMPLGLLSLSSCLRKNGLTSRIYKPRIRLLDIEDYKAAAQDVAGLKPAFIGFSTWCNSYPASLLLAEQIKKIDKTLPVIFGGPQASILAYETLENFSYIDYILTGEAEYALICLVHALRNDAGYNEKLTISGLFFRTDTGQIVHPKSVPIVPDLDEIPVPAYDLIGPSKVLELDVGRGCPFKCTYCSTASFFSGKYRMKSVERIIREMDFASEETGATYFSFTHDIFTLDRKYIDNFCFSLINHCENTGKKYEWSCSARADSISEEMLVSMKNAGCLSVFLGMESGSPKIQKLIGKNLNVTSGYKLTDACIKLGIDVHISFIIGFPYETGEDLEKTLQCIVELAMRGAFVQVSELSVLPGTPLSKTHGKDLKYDGFVSNFSHSICSSTEVNIIREHPEIFSSFYYLPVSLMDHESVVILCRLINVLHNFRNTVFLLREYINRDIRGMRLLEFFLSRVDEIKELQKSDYPLVSVCTNLLKNYLLLHKPNEIPLFIFDIFVWESTESMLQAKFLRWQIIHPEHQQIQKRKLLPEDYADLFPTPLWQIFTTDYDIAAIAPTKNGWKTESIKIRKRKYFYLSVAKSEDKCDLTRLTARDYGLLTGLKGQPDSEYLRTKASFRNEKSRNQWMAKMVKLSVLGTNELHDQ